MKDHALLFDVPARVDTTALPWRLLLWDDDAGLWRPVGALDAPAYILCCDGSILVDTDAVPILP